MSEDRPQMSEAFALLVQVALRDPGFDKSEATQVVRFGSWVASINKRRDAMQMGDTTVPPFSAVVEYDGWPVGIINPAGGTMLRGAEDDMIAALQTVIAERAS